MVAPAMVKNPRTSWFDRLARPFSAGKHTWLMVLFVWLVAIAPAQASAILRVAIERGESEVRVGSSTPAIVLDGSGTNLGELEEMTAFYARPSGGGVRVGDWQAGRIWIRPTGDGYVYIGDRWYRGDTLLVPHEGGVTAIDYVDLEEYLYSVLGSEMYPNWPAEALKTQAVAARSYVLYRRERQGNALYDVGNTTVWQVYKGLEAETNTTQSAVEATEGQVLVHGDKIIEALYHASSGGHTENVEYVWTGEPRPYLKGVRDEFDRESPTFEWVETVSQGEMRAAIGGIGTVLSLTPERTSPQGRILSMRAVGTAGTKSVSGRNLRRDLDLRSTWFQIASRGSGQFEIVGRGFGHGVGMSQWGALGMARQGFDYRQILAHYYQNTSLARVEVR